MTTRQVRATCPHDCPDTCALLITVEDGVATQVKGDPDHPTTAGVRCTKVACYAERTYYPDRLLYPMRRVGNKGEGKFERISWDAAIGEIAQRLGAIAARAPQAILPYSYCGTMGLVQGASLSARFFHRLGASVGTDLEQFQDARLILIWDGNPIASNLHFWTRVQEAKRRGAKVIAIDPYRSLTAEKCHQHIALLPGTDSALALGMMHVLIGENLLDDDYIARHTVGFDQLRARAAATCGISALEVVNLARDCGQAARRGEPVAIRLNYGVQLSSSGSFPLNRSALQRPDLLAQPARTINMSTIGDDLLRASSASFGPKIDALIVYNANPLAIAPDSSKVTQGFLRDDLFTVVLEQFQTDSADYADILLPATTQLEHVDAHLAYGRLYMMANSAAIAPLGEAKPNTEIFCPLAARMGFDDACFRHSDDDLAAQAFDARDARDARAVHFDWESLKARGWQKLDLPDAPFANGGFLTPSGKCEFYSAAMLRDGFDPLPTYTAPYESAFDNPDLARRYPLAMISPPARNFLNSTFVNLKSLRGIEDQPYLDIHPAGSVQRAICHVDMVRIFNDRGAFVAKARVTDKTRAGLVVGLSVWWKKPASDGKNVNEVTSQRLTDMGHAPIFYDTLVQV